MAAWRCRARLATCSSSIHAALVDNKTGGTGDQCTAPKQISSWTNHCNKLTCILSTHAQHTSMSSLHQAGGQASGLFHCITAPLATADVGRRHLTTFPALLRSSAQPGDQVLRKLGQVECTSQPGIPVVELEMWSHHGGSGHYNWPAPVF